MTYKVNFNGGNKQETLESLDRQMQASIDSQNATDKDADGIRRLIDALPDGNITGFVQNNNNGTTTIQVTSREVAPAEVTQVRSTAASRAGATGAPSNANRPMESERANRGGEPARSTTGAGGPVVNTGAAATGGASDAKTASQAKAAEAKPGNTQ